MRFGSSIKKRLAVLAAAGLALTASGCRVATNADGTIKLITESTTFKEIFATENWFNSLLVYPMAKFLNRFSPTFTVGGALIILTISVNIVMFLLTIKSTIASQQMQLLQPEMNKIQRKYEGKTDEQSRMKQSSEINALYKKYNINPMSMILVQFIQFPVMIAMYHAVQRSVAVKTGAFFGLSLATKPLDGLRSGVWGYALLFLFMGVMQYVSVSLPQWLAKKKAAEEAAKHHRKPETADSKQNKYMQLYMMAMILFFGLTLPSAMALYWSMTSLVAVLKTFAVQKIIKNTQTDSGVKA